MTSNLSNILVGFSIALSMAVTSAHQQVLMGSAVGYSNIRGKAPIGIV
jgi:hypothetical protein